MFSKELLFINFKPSPDSKGFLENLKVQSRDGLEVGLAVLDAKESRSFFGVPLARRGIQPVWVQISNRSELPYRLHFISIDPNYFSPLEAACINHFSGSKRFLNYGILAWLIFLPLIFLLPIKLISLLFANRRVDSFFQEHAFRMKPIPPGGEQSGFVYTNLSLGSKSVPIKLMSPQGVAEFNFTVSVPGLDVDFLRREFESLHPVKDVKVVDLDGLKNYLAEAPKTTTNRRGSRGGDPVNLVVIGNFARLLSAFSSRWDETESISWYSCWKTAKAFALGAEYRYSPVSSLYLFNRSQDVALQRIRKSINERIHLRLWTTDLRFRGQPVWIGQVSRDIGVRFTLKTWNLTTHRIEPDVDEARDYVVEDLLNIGRLELAGYAPGASPTTSDSPAHNLTGDPYYTDGKRAVIMLSEGQTKPEFVDVE